jgi:hypothetical protein
VFVDGGAAYKLPSWIQSFVVPTENRDTDGLRINRSYPGNGRPEFGEHRIVWDVPFRLDGKRKCFSDPSLFNKACDLRQSLVSRPPCFETALD